MKYKKETSRITVKFIDANTEETLFEVPDRNHMNLGDIFSDSYCDILLQRELKAKNIKLPKRVLVLAVTELVLTELDSRIFKI
jgi:hypothetical protein